MRAFKPGASVPEEKHGAIGRRLDRVLEAVLKRRGMINVACAVERVDQSFQWSGAAGEADVEGRRMTPETPWYSGGIEVFYNAVIAARLVERGALDLDLPITEYLDPSLVAGLHAAHGTDRTGDLTTRHLLGHSSGLADWLEDSPRGGGRLGILETVLREGDRTVSREEILRTVRQDLEPHFDPSDPGEPKRIRYSNTNNILVVLILEAITGQALPEIHRTMVWDQCSLRDTWFPNTRTGHDGPATPLAHPPTPATPPPADLHFQGEPQNVPGLLHALGGFHTTLGDTMRFLRAVVTGKIYDDPATASLITRRWTRFPFPLDRVAMRQPSWPIEYGLGVMRFHLRRVFTPRAMMPSVIGHTGSTGSWILWSPERDTILAGTVNDLAAGALPFQMVVPRIMNIPALR